MATPTLTQHTLPGVLGEILVDVRAGGRDSPRPAVVVMHGFKGFKDWGMFPPLAERLAQAGFSAVSFNASGSGVDESGEFVWPERFGRNTFSAELTRSRGRRGRAGRRHSSDTAAPAAIGLVGHSRGGGMAVLQAARDPRVRALVTWAAIAHVERWTDPVELARWRERGRIDVLNARTGQVLPLYAEVLDDIERNKAAERSISRGPQAEVSVPWLLIHGTGDTSVRSRKPTGSRRRRRRTRSARSGWRARVIRSARCTPGRAARRTSTWSSRRQWAGSPGTFSERAGYRKTCRE